MRARPPALRAQTCLPLKFRRFSPLVAVRLSSLLSPFPSSHVSPFFPLLCRLTPVVFYFSSCLCHFDRPIPLSLIYPASQAEYPVIPCPMEDDFVRKAGFEMRQTTVGFQSHHYLCPRQLTLDSYLMHCHPRLIGPTRIPWAQASAFQGHGPLPLSLVPFLPGLCSPSFQRASSRSVLWAEHGLGAC